MYRLALVLPLILLLPSSVLAQEGGTTENADIEGIELRIDPTAPRVQIPVAVPDAMNSGESDPATIAATISVTLRRDLDLAGVFQVLGPATFFFDQHADGMSESTVNFQNWFNAGAQAVAKTAFRVAGSQVRLDFRLFNVAAGSQVELDFAPITVGFDDVEDQVHEFANQILLYFSGYRGPFGGRVAFSGRGRDGSREIYSMTIGGSSINAITTDRNINILPEWVGGSVAYTTYVRGNPDLAIGGSSDRRFVSTRSGINSGGAQASSGGPLAVALSLDGNTEIYVISSEDGSMIGRLTNNRAEDVDPCWSPGGSQIAFVSDRSGGPQIYIMNADGSDQRRVTFAGNYNTEPDWAPDGTRISFTGRDSRNRFDIFAVDVATSHIERFTQDQGDNQSASWSPDGQYMVFSSTRGGGDPRLWMMTADGTFQTLLTSEGSGYSTPTWRR